jgi:glycosyltransferase involved in cell wall biosynthesis
MTTYNHERFIAQAIDSVLMQKVNFDYEIVIGEDHSTDGTRDIVVDYQKRFPGKIRLKLREKNPGDEGKSNFVETLKSGRGEYISWLDGDDYWTSPHKLQKQVDFLDNHPECAICFHSAKVVYEDGSCEPFIFLPPDKKEIYSLEDLLEKNLMTALSAMFRRGLFGEFPKWFYLTPMGDWPLHILNAQHGKIGYINEVMGVYRIHSGGWWTVKGLIHNLQGRIYACRFINAHFDFRYNKIMKSRVSLDYLRLAEEYKQRGDRISALKSLVRCIGTYPCNQAISSLRLFLMILELSSPGLYKILKSLKNKYLR